MPPQHQEKGMGLDSPTAGARPPSLWGDLMSSKEMGRDLLRSQSSWDKVFSPAPILTILSPHTTFQGWFQTQIYPHPIHPASIFETGLKWPNSLLRFLKDPIFYIGPPLNTNISLLSSALPPDSGPRLSLGCYSAVERHQKSRISFLQAEGQISPCTNSGLLRSASQRILMLIRLGGPLQLPSK